MDWDFKVARMSNGRENCRCQLQSQLNTIILKVHLRANNCYFSRPAIFFAQYSRSKCELQLFVVTGIRYFSDVCTDGKF